MKVFIGQAVTGEDIDQLRAQSRQICEVFGERAYCTLLEESEFESRSNHDKMRHAFEKLDACDTFLAIVRSEKRSEGMLVEFGYALAKSKRIIVAVNKAAADKTYLPEMADEVIKFSDTGDLLRQLNGLK